MSVYVWGFGKLGQLGNGRTDTCHTPVAPKLPAKTKCAHIHSGGYFTAVVTTDGRIFSFGCGKYGRLGTTDEQDRLEPTEVVQQRNGKEVTVRFKQVSCGIWHGAALTTDDNVYVWGHNTAVGDVGDVGVSSAPLKHSLPTLVRGPFTSKVAGVSCGNNFTLLWTSDGEAYSWGCGRNGVLGQNSTENLRSPALISSLKEANNKVTFMSAGFAHSGAVTDVGEVFMFGKSSDGALGIGSSSKDVTVPKLVEKLNGVIVKELSCSVGDKHGHTLFVTGDGRVYACGDGYKGKLGLGDQETRLVPTEIPAENFGGEAISHVAAGGIHSAAVGAKGHVFTWGCGSDGRLGHPDGKGHRYLFRSDIPRVVDGLAEAGKAVLVSSSYYHTVALMN